MEKIVNGIAINVKDIYNAGKVLNEIVAEAGPSYWGKDWMSMNKNLFSALKMEKTAMFIILILIVLVAAFNIASMLIMMVMEKRKDIAILKAMGASDKIIKKIFMLKGLTIGGIGTFIGVVFGICLTFALSKYKFISLPEDIYFFATLPVELKLTDIIVITASSLFICFIATIYPARQAAKLNPVDAIRYG
jgi:lipoprotein-releasing system permease protein